MRGNKTSKKYEKITISFTEADSDIIEYVRELKKSNKASEFIREAIREKINRVKKENEIEYTVEKLEDRINNLEKLISININGKDKQEEPGQTEKFQYNFNREEHKEILETEENKVIEEAEEEKIEEVKEQSSDGVVLDDDILNAIDFFN